MTGPAPGAGEVRQEELGVEAMAKGRAGPANDTMIAATAASTSRALLTTDASAGFDQLTVVRAEVLKLP